MALRELPSALRQLVTRDLRSTATSAGYISRRYASGQAVAVQEASEDLQDLESQSALTSTELSPEVVEGYDPVKRSQGRKRQLPASRYGDNALKRSSPVLKNFTDTNIDPQDTIEGLCILTSLL
jgi:large subunit ribosomal protein L5